MPVGEALRREGVPGVAAEAHERTLAPPDGAYLFDSTGPRRRLARGAKVPERWSTDVVSRVLVQDAALPALAAVCGPGEIAYWAQLKGAQPLSRARVQHWTEVARERARP